MLSDDETTLNDQRQHALLGPCRCRAASTTGIYKGKRCRKPAKKDSYLCEHHQGERIRFKPEQYERSLNDGLGQSWEVLPNAYFRDGRLRRRTLKETPATPSARIVSGLRTPEDVEALVGVSAILGFMRGYMCASGETDVIEKGLDYKLFQSGPEVLAYCCGALAARGRFEEAEQLANVVRAKWHWDEDRGEKTEDGE